MSEAHGITLTPLTGLSARLVSHDWAWARDNAVAIAGNWERRLAERPRMFDGRVLLSCGCSIRDGFCEMLYFETRFSNFLSFRESGSPDPAVANAFAAIVPVTGDGAILLGEMAPHTANAGRIYFPCGTPDPDDLRAGGIVDLAGSAEREFVEETGLRLPREAEPSPWVLMRGNGQCAFLRPVRFAASTQDLLATIAEHHAGEAVPELSRMVVVRSRPDIEHERMPGFVQAYLDSILPS